ncbi:MAG: acyl-CoA reductase [Bacteroidetes bacterium]|nr:MAG: acyl-CoA reductase [Bacteroidota bacterium]
MKTGIFFIEKRIEAFAALGRIFRDAAAGADTGHAGVFNDLAESLHLSNPWFTPGNVRRSLLALGNSLTPQKLTAWLSRYPELADTGTPLTIGVIMAGNIPLVGFHDMLCVLVTGNRIQARLSTKDEPLMKAAAMTLTDIEPGFAPLIDLTTDRLRGFDMIIATGSNNTSRYFEYYFRKVPSIIRHNRNSIAILDGTENNLELECLADDIFSYFGLGCRNVSKLYLPEGYDPASLVPHWKGMETLQSHYKYNINYDHNRAVMIVNREKFIDGGFFLLRESPSLTPPMGVVHYEYYPAGMSSLISPEMKQNLLQCIAGHGHLPFGTTQQPELWDYADNVDTISFLLKKNNRQ